MTRHTFTAAEVAEHLRCSARKVRETATRLGLGVDLGGRAGYRYTAADIDALWESLRPAPIPERRRRRRAS